ALPQTLKGSTSFDSFTILGETSQQASFGEVRHWHAYGTSPSAFDLAFLSESVVRISNTHPASFGSAWILVNGIVYPVGEIQRGAHEYVLDPAASLRMNEFIEPGYTQHASSAVQIIYEIKDVLSLTQGIWLIAEADDVRFITGDITKKVRDITLVIARGQEVEREI
ncbi:hypothetical protein KAR02_15180, partial [Candidatus Bipolaricaulota bacterium]|nr:hypothetical protein [Candidatus Bipolaricaulota bacterium]